MLIRPSSSSAGNHPPTPVRESLACASTLGVQPAGEIFVPQSLCLFDETSRAQILQDKGYVRRYAANRAPGMHREKFMKRS